MLATQLYSVADTMVIGLKLDASALAAASNASSVLMIFLFISGGIELGANLLIGAKKPVMSRQEISDLAYNVIFVDGAAALAVTVMGFFAFPALLKMINTPEEIISDAVVYGRIYMLGVPFLMYYDVSKQILIGAGDSKTPLYLVLATSVMNIILDLVLTGPMGVAGAALASSASQVVGVIAVTFPLKLKVLVGSFSFRILNGQSFKDIVRLSFPNVLQQMTGPLVSNVRQSLLGGIGVAAIAGFSCASKLLTLMGMAIGGFTQGLVIFIAQNLAIAERERVSEGVRVSVKIQLVFVTVVAAVFMMFRQALLSLFTSDAEAMVYGEVLLMCEPAVYFIQIITRAKEAKLRGMQKMTLYTLSSLSTTAVNLIATAVLVKSIGFKGFYMGAYISAVYSAVAATAFVRKAENSARRYVGSRSACK